MEYLTVALIFVFGSGLCWVAYKIGYDHGWDSGWAAAEKWFHRGF